LAQPNWPLNLSDDNHPLKSTATGHCPVAFLLDLVAGGIHPHSTLWEKNAHPKKQPLPFRSGCHQVHTM
jgi:hypothetical protein